MDNAERICSLPSCNNRLQPHQKSYCCKPHYGEAKRGSVRSHQAASEHPTTLDIAWAAGIFEGEGYCYLPQHIKERRYYPARAQVTQKDTWILERFLKLFGGSIGKGNNGTSVWYCYSARADGFLMTIYKFLSPRRQAQARYALAGVPQTKTESDLGSNVERLAEMTSPATNRGR